MGWSPAPQSPNRRAGPIAPAKVASSLTSGAPSAPGGTSQLVTPRPAGEGLAASAARSAERRYPLGPQEARMHRSRLFASLAVVAVTLAAVGPVASQTPRKGGVLRVGMIGEPPTLDQHATTAVITREIGINMFEGLYTLDAKLQPVPLLAEGHEVLDGARRYVIRLRADVKFHNGKPMTSADVVASLRRWGAVSGSGKSI